LPIALDYDSERRRAFLPATNDATFVMTKASHQLVALVISSLNYALPPQKKDTGDYFIQFVM